MNILFLRGQVPKDRSSKEIVFDKLEECDDVWTQLAYSLCNKEDNLELWYWDGTRRHRFKENFVERWVTDFSTANPEFEPDVIFARGAFTEYHKVFKRFPNAYKIRYGAGRRYLPSQGYYGYDLILQDSKEQVDECRKKFPDVRSELFIKPAPDNLFYSCDISSMESRVFDICFPANGTQSFKGHQFVYKTAPPDVSILNLGLPSKIPTPSTVDSYRVLRKDIAKHMSKCKIGIVAVSSKIDSCPRVIPEMLATGLPIVVLDDVRFWKEKYIVSGVTGELATKETFWKVVKKVLSNYKQYTPREYYKNNLSLIKASEYLRNIISEHHRGSNGP